MANAHARERGAYERGERERVHDHSSYFLEMSGNGS